jgi:hypothetical protein
MAPKGRPGAPTQISGAWVKSSAEAAMVAPSAEKLTLPSPAPVETGALQTDVSLPVAGSTAAISDCSPRRSTACSRPPRQGARETKLALMSGVRSTGSPPASGTA